MTPELTFHSKTSPIHVDVFVANAIPPEARLAWTLLRAQNPALWSPYFDIRMFDILAQCAPHAHIAIASSNGEIVALLPFQGKKGGLARPLGAPLSDQHDLIAKPDCDITMQDVIAKAGMTGFVFSGLLHQVSGTLKSDTSLCHIADLTEGLDAYIAWRKANWNDQVKKNERRKRQGARQWGPLRIEIACPRTSTHFQTLMAWKQAKYLETNRHNVLAVPWINSYLRRLYESPDPMFVGEISLLYFGDHLAATEFGLRAGNAMHSWFPTFDRTYAQVSPGILLMDGMIEACAGRGITKVDLGIGHDQYKRHASNAPITVYSGTLPISIMRKFGTQTFLTINKWLENNRPETLAPMVSRFVRRNEMILAAEPTLTGRLAGYVTALKAISAPV